MLIKRRGEEERETVKAITVKKKLKKMRGIYIVVVAGPESWTIVTDNK